MCHGVAENEEKPFMVLRLIHTSYKGLISIYSYDTHKTGITFKLMLSSCRFTFIFGNPHFPNAFFSLVRLLSACRHKFSLIFFSSSPPPKILLAVMCEDEVEKNENFFLKMASRED